MQIEHDRQGHRFRTVVEGHTSEVDYRLDGEVMTITHTGVPDAIAGRGVAATLMRAALDHARVQGWKVVPACSYAIGFMKRVPDYDDLRAS